MGQKNSTEFLKIRQHVLDMIATSGYRTQVLPSSRKLGEMFDVTHPTVLRALQSLIADGFIKPLKGGGSVTCPEHFDFHDTRIFGLLVGDGHVAMDIYYHCLVAAALTVPLTRMRDNIALQHLYINEAADFDKAVDREHLAGLLLVGVRDPYILRQAARLRAEGFPVAAYIHAVDGVGSWGFRSEDVLAAVLDRLLGEGRRRLAVLSEATVDGRERFRAVIDDACRRHEADPSEVVILEGYVQQLVRRMEDVLAGGERFDGIVGFRNFRKLFKLVADHCDVEHDCRMVNLEFSIYENLRFTGYGVHFDLDHAAARLIDHLWAQVEGRDPPVVSETIGFRLLPYRDGAVIDQGRKIPQPRIPQLVQ